AIVVGVLRLQVAFIASYTHGLNAPNENDIPVDVVAPQNRADQLAAGGGEAASRGELNSVATLEEGRDNIRDGSSFGIYAPAQNELYIASAAGPPATEIARRTMTAVAEQTRAPPDTTDLAPLPEDNSRGLVGYYLVIGWLVGAYLLAAILGLYRGMSPATRARGL